jgi:trehalose synthase
MSESQVETPISTLDDYKRVLGEAEISELRTLAERLRGRSVQMVNSTAVGGGVAEILNRMVPLMQELEVTTRWDVITGGEDFVAITKAFHNALHGDGFRMPDDSFKTFLAYNKQNQARLDFDSDFTLIHDPQPVALIDARHNHDGHWI